MWLWCLVGWFIVLCCVVVVLFRLGFYWWSCVDWFVLLLVVLCLIVWLWLVCFWSGVVRIVGGVFICLFCGGFWVCGVVGWVCCGLVCFFLLVCWWFCWCSVFILCVVCCWVLLVLGFGCVLFGRCFCFVCGCCGWFYWKCFLVFGVLLFGCCWWGD